MTVTPAGYGHNRITVDFNGQKYSKVTNNTRLTDRFKFDSYEEAEDPEDYLSAKQEAVELVLDANEVPYVKVTAEYKGYHGVVIEVTTED